MAKIQEELLTQEYATKLENLICSDWTFKKLSRKYQSLNNKPTKQMTILAEMEKRREELANIVISEYLNERERKRQFIEDLPLEKREKYLILKNAMCFACDCLETIVMDINDLFTDSVIQYKYEIPGSFKDALKDIRSWVTSELTQLDNKGNQLYADEADKITDFLLDRSRIYENKKKRMK